MNRVILLALLIASLTNAYAQENNPTWQSQQRVQQEQGWMMMEQQRLQQEQMANQPPQPQVRYKTVAEQEAEIRANERNAKIQQENLKRLNEKTVQTMSANDFYVSIAIGTNDGRPLMAEPGFNTLQSMNNRPQAERDALQNCQQKGLNNCRILATYANACGVIYGKLNTDGSDWRVNTAPGPEFLVTKTNAMCQKKYGSNCGTLPQTPYQYPICSRNLPRKEFHQSSDRGEYWE
ncbi:DUF4189 domain-containing protein [Paralysiella testudinis]